MSVDLRGLRVLASRPHDNISRRSLGLLRLLVRIITLDGRLCETKHSASQTSHVTTSIGSDGAQQSLTGFLRQVGFLQYTLGRVYVGKIHDSSRMARVKDGCQTHTRLQGSHTSEVNFVVNNMSSSLVIDRIDDLVVAVVFVTVQILGLTTVTYVLLANCLFSLDK